MRFKCCNKCFSNLCSVDFDSGLLWAEICKHACIRKGRLSFKLNHDLDHEFSILEGLGFIKTHETNQELMVRVQGHILDDDIDAFCIEVGKHGLYA